MVFPSNRSIFLISLMFSSISIILGINSNSESLNCSIIFECRPALALRCKSLVFNDLTISKVFFARSYFLFLHRLCHDDNMLLQN